MGTNGLYARRFFHDYMQTNGFGASFTECLSLEGNNKFF